MRLFLDDVREPPTAGWLLVKTANECITMLETHAGHVTHLSLDHDLSAEHYGYHTKNSVERAARERGEYMVKTGYDVALWLVTESEKGWQLGSDHCYLHWPDTIILHTHNPTGRYAMRQLLARYKPDRVCLIG